MNLRGKWGNTSVANKLNVILTAILVVVTAVNVWNSISQSDSQSKQASALTSAIGQVNTALANGATETKNAVEAAIKAGNEATDRTLRENRGVFSNALKTSITQSKAALDASIGNFRQQQRAWIAPKNAALREQISVGKPVQLDITYNNVGREPALDIRPVYHFKSVSDSSFMDNTVNAIIEADDICKGVVPASGADVAYPNNLEGYTLQFKTQPDWIRQDLAASKTVMLFEMCIAYRSVGEVHQTAFCFFYRPGVTQTTQLNICTAGNHAN